MLCATVLINNEKKEIIINQKQVCSFSKKTIDGQKITELRMSNGDIWNVLDPIFDSWYVDGHITSTDY